MGALQRLSLPHQNQAHRPTQGLSIPPGTCYFDKILKT
ncbi:rCG48753 [Rattus norvegicus]|uniref:RCG48753 n=1 Tax=Rattus norvegicus TaxID=10116 RepID=A6IGZ4_RAT|nr:rCG48753 [Rattus norvegicus]